MTDDDKAAGDGPARGVARHHVAVVISGIETYGIQSFLLTQFRNTARDEIDFSYLAVEDGDCARALRAAGASVAVTGGRIQMPYPGHPLLVPLFWLWWWLDFYRAYSGIRQALRKTRYGIVYTHSYYGLVISALAARGNGCRMIGQLHGRLNDQRLAGLQRVLVSLALAGAADRLIAISDFVAASLWGPARRKVARIDNSVDIQAIAETTRGVVRDPRRIVIVGRLVGWKKQQLAIRAVDILRRRGVDCRLDIIGGRGHTDPPGHEQMLRELVASLELADRVTFLGAVSPPYRHVAAAAVCVSCSTREPFGLVIIEAAACGTAVVAADAGATRELIEDGRTGLLFCPDDPDSLAGMLQRLLDDGALRQSLAGTARQQALARYGISQHLHRLRSCFDEVLE